MRWDELNRDDILIIGNKNHVTIINSILHLSKKPIPDLRSYYRAKSVIGNASMYAKLLSHIALSGDNIVLHIIHPAHNLSLKIAEISMRKGYKVVFHWIGSDVLLADKRNYFSVYKELFRYTIHITVAPWLKEELEERGVEVRGIAPLIPLDQLGSLSELVHSDPGGFNVGYYLPEGSESLYDSSLIDAVSKVIDKGKILVAGSRGNSSSNIEFLGKIPRSSMPEFFYKRIMTLVRMPRHDGFSQMVMETLLSGRYVVYNMPLNLPCVYHAKTRDEALDKISRLYESYLNGKVKPDPQCAEGLLRTYNPRRIAALLLEIWLS